MRGTGTSRAGTMPTPGAPGDSPDRCLWVATAAPCTPTWPCAASKGRARCHDTSIPSSGAHTCSADIRSSSSMDTRVPVRPWRLRSLPRRHGARLAKRVGRGGSLGRIVDPPTTADRRAGRGHPPRPTSGRPCACAVLPDRSDPRVQNVGHYLGTPPQASGACGRRSGARRATAGMDTALLAYSGISIKMLVDGTFGSSLLTMFTVDYEPGGAARFTTIPSRRRTCSWRARSRARSTGTTTSFAPARSCSVGSEWYTASSTRAAAGCDGSRRRRRNRLGATPTAGRPIGSRYGNATPPRTSRMGQPAAGSA